VECWTGTHQKYFTASILFIFVYVLGVPSMVLKLLYDRKEQIKNEPDNAVLHEEFGSLYEEYEPSCWWFEIVQMSRKMLLTGGLLVIRSDSATTIMVGIMVCFGYLLLLTNWGPFLEDDDDKMEQVAAVQLFISILMGLVLQLQSQSGEPEDPLFGIILVLMNAAVMGCAAYMLLKVLTGMGGVMSDLKGSSIRAVKAVKHKAEKALKKPQDVQKGVGKEDSMEAQVKQPVRESLDESTTTVTTTTTTVTTSKKTFPVPGPGKQDVSLGQAKLNSMPIRLADLSKATQGVARGEQDENTVFDSENLPQ